MKKTTIITLILIGGVFIAFSALAKSPISFKRIDFVNIGSPDSEAGHNLQGWGPIEPQTNGGNWGKIASEENCGLDSSQECDRALRVTYASDEPDHPVINGRMATLTFKLDKKDCVSAKELKIRALDGIANDDFMVFVRRKGGNWHHIYTYISDPSTEEIWKVHTIKFGLKKLCPKCLCPKYLCFDCVNKKCSKEIQIGILATGNTWSQHSTYGQLGIDWIELLGWKRPTFPHLPPLPCWPSAK